MWVLCTSGTPTAVGVPQFQENNDSLQEFFTSKWIRMVYLVSEAVYH